MQKAVPKTNLNSILLLVSCLTFFLLSFNLNAQDKYEYEYRTDLTFQERVNLGEAYFAKIDKDKRKGTGYNQFQRWKYWTQQSLDVKGYVITDAAIQAEVKQFNSLYGNQENNFANNSFSEMGPMSATNTSTWSSALGRLTSIAVANDNTFNHILVSSPGGGVWKTTNGGTNWIPLFDNMPTLTAWSVAISHANSQHYFVGTEGGGMFKSTDGGSSWTQTAGVDTWDRINTIRMHPTNPNILYAIGEWAGKVYISTNSGDSWSNLFIAPTGLYDLEFKPNSPSTIYISGRSGFIAKSTTSGNAFTPINLPNPYVTTGTIMLGVSPANPDYIYALQEIDGSFNALFRSTDSGNTFTTRSTNASGLNNLLGYSLESDRGQAPRDMDVIVSPTNINEVQVAGIESHRSFDGGSTFTQNSWWRVDLFAAANLTFHHADVDALYYIRRNGINRIYAATDGGIYYSDDNGVNFTDITPGIGIRQFYRIGASQTVEDWVSGGSQDNGTGVHRNDGNWYDWLGADGMECIVDYTDANIMYGTSQYGGLYKSIDGGNTRRNLPRPAGVGAWVTPLEQDPVNPSTLYFGLQNLHKSTDGANSWHQISNFSIDDATVWWDTSLLHVKVAPSNPNIIYASFSERLYKTTNGGTSWTNISPMGYNFRINFITIHPTNPDRFILSFSSTSNGYKYIESSNEGVNWTDITSNLPAVGTRCVLYSGDANDAIYLGMQTGLYYKDNSSGGLWSNIGTSGGLPNVAVTELEIRLNNLYIATYGRGLWKTAIADCIETISFTGDTLICKDIDYVYQAPLLQDALSYTWELPNGWTGVSSDNEILVTPGANSGIISVSINVGCGTVTATKNVTVKNQCNTVLDFDGVDDYLDIQDGLLDTISDFTIETWVYLDQAPENHYAIWGLGTTQSRIFLGMTPSLFRFRIVERSGAEEITSDIDSDVVPSYNTWHHIAVTYHSASKTATLYLDGTVLGVNTNMLLEPKDLTVTDSLLIGNSNSSYNIHNNLDGKIDEFRFWSYARSAEELEAYRNCSPVSPEEGLLVHYNFEEGTPNENNSSRTQVANNMPADYPADFQNFTLTEGRSNYIVTPSSFIDTTCINPNASIVLDFDGVDDYIDVRDDLLNGVTNYTIETWFYYDESPESHYSLFDFGKDWNARINMQIKPNDFTFQISNWDFDNSRWVGSIIESDVMPCSGSWHHAAISYQSNIQTAIFYLNGIEVGRDESIAVEPGDLFARDELYIGRSLDFENNTYFKGKMDEFRVWRYARSAAEINANKDIPLMRNESNMKAYYDFERGIPAGDNTDISSVHSFSEFHSNAILHGFSLLGTASNFVEATKITDCNEPIIYSDNSVMDFDGVDDYLRIKQGLLDTISDFTIETWFYMDRIPDHHYSIYGLGNQNSRIFLGVNASLFRFQITKKDETDDIFSRIDSDVLPSVQTWHHVAISYQAATQTATFYLDGMVTGINDTMLLEPKDLIATDSLLIGWNVSSNTDNNSFNGKMDEFRFWSYARSEEQLEAYRNCSPVSPEEGLLVHYNFEEGIQNGANSSRTQVANNMPTDYPADLLGFTLSGGQSNYTGASSTFIDTTCTNPSNPSTVLDFDGIDDYLDIQDGLIDGVTDFTVETWFYYDESPNSHYSLFDLGKDWNARINLQIKPNDFTFQISNWDWDNSRWVGSVIQSDSMPCPGGWYHAAISYQSDIKTAKLYLNGVVVGVENEILVEPQDLFAKNELYIGRSHDYQNNTYFKGKMDEFRFWLYARSVEEINATKDIPLTGTESGLQTYYDFEEGTPDGNNTAITQITSPLEIEYNAVIHGMDLTGNNSNFIETTRTVKDTSCYSPVPLTTNTVMDLDGINDHLMIPSGLLDTISDFTVETWFYMDGPPDHHYTLLGLGNFTSRIAFAISPSIFRFQITNNNTQPNMVFSRIDTDVPSYQNWHHVAVSYHSASKTATLYLDGLDKGSENNVLLEPKDLILKDSLMIGTSFSPYAENTSFNGKIDEFRFWSYARSAAEIDYYRNCMLQGSEQGLLVYYNFEEGNQQGDNKARTTVQNNTLFNYSAAIKNVSLSGKKSNYISASSLFVDGNCPNVDVNNCQLPVLPVMGSANNNGLYHGIDTLYSRAIISADSIITFRAGAVIILNPGFHAQAGATLEVAVEACNLSPIIPEEIAITAKVIKEEVTKIDELALQISPNPFRHTANIRFYLPEETVTHIFVTNLNGQLLMEQKMISDKGWHQTILDAKDLKAGIYLVTLQTASQRITKKVMLLQ